jgi:hypothetical protein
MLVPGRRGHRRATAATNERTYQRSCTATGNRADYPAAGCADAGSF